MSLPPRNRNQQSSPRTAAAPHNTSNLKPELSAPNGFVEQVFGPMKAWDTPGQEVYAYFLGMRASTVYEGRSVVDFVDDSGTVETYSCPNMLEQLLRGLERRTPVLVYYRGDSTETVDNKARTMKHFQVFRGS